MANGIEKYKVEKEFIKMALISFLPIIILMTFLVIDSKYHIYHVDFGFLFLWAVATSSWYTGYFIGKMNRGDKK